MSHFLQDLRYALRRLRQDPGFSATAVGTVALGIALTTAVFSVVNTVLLKPLPVRDPERFVLLTTAGAEEGSSPAKFIHWRAESAILEDVSAVLDGNVNYRGASTSELWRSARVSADAFHCWGIPILAGRVFAPEEDVPHGARVAVISQDLRKRRFADAANPVGQAISLDGEDYTIIGVAGPVAAMHEFGPSADVYLPFQTDPNTTEQGNYFDVVARLKPGVTLQQAQARLRLSTAEYRTKFPGALGPNDVFTAKPMREAIVGDTGSLLWLLLGAVALVLLIACANVANLLLAQAARRKHEIAIRAAIGAGRARVIRQLLTESLLISGAGGVLGLLLGSAAIRALLRVNTAELPLVGANGAEVTLDWRVAAFAFVLAIVTGAVFGLYPAFQSAGADLVEALKTGGNYSGTGRRQHRTRAWLVAGEVSLALILLTGSGLLIRSFTALYAVNPGLETRNVFTMDVLMTGAKYAKTGATASALRRSLEAIRSIPGISAAGVTCCPPLAQGTYDMDFEILGRPVGHAAEDVGWSTVSPGYFDAYRIPVKRGRTFNDRDDRDAPPVALINEAMAAKYWPGADPLRDRIKIGGTGDFKDEPVRQVIGIVGDVREEGLSAKPRPVMYVPEAQLTDAVNAFFLRLMPMSWIIRANQDPRLLIQPVKARVEEATGLPVTGVSPMDRVVWAQTSRQRFNLLVMTIFGCSALFLAAIGLYGLLSQTVARQRREIGIRLALGASAAGMRRMILGQGMRLVLAGAGVGLTGAWALSRLLESLLFGVRAHDYTVFLGVPVVLAAAALLAIWPAARRASEIDPAQSLRSE